MWHGWADGAIMATSSIGYYEGVRKFMGGRGHTEDFFRLFFLSREFIMVAAAPDSLNSTRSAHWKTG